MQHYWIVDPAQQQFEFWQWSSEGYQLSALDPDGCYRGINDLSFSPELFWLNMQENHPLYNPKLSACTGIAQPRQWVLRKEPGAELSYGSLPFTPTVGLSPQLISPEQFISWCPETKLEGGPFPLVGGSEAGTRNAIAMLLMSIGLVETVRLVSGYEWVRALRRITREQARDAELKAMWWQIAQETALKLVNEHGAGGVGIIGALVDDKPLNRWSQIHLVLWDVPEEFKAWSIAQLFPEEIPAELTQAVWAAPGDWKEITERIKVLAGSGQPHGPRPQERMVLNWLDTDS